MRDVRVERRSGGICLLTGYYKLREARCWIKFTIERPLRKEEEQYLGGSAHDASMHDMTAHHSTFGIGDAHMEVRPVARDCSGQSRPGRRMEDDAARRSGRKHAADDHPMEVQVGIEGGTEAVDEGDCAEAGREARTWTVRPQASLHHAQEQAQG
jgi:hypothetical protein